MDDEQQRRIDEAARRFTEALVESYRSVADRAVGTQELNRELTQTFFNDVIDNLRRQTQDTEEMTSRLADQQQRQREAAQTLTQESVNVYMDFVNSMFSFYRGGVEAAERSTEEATRSVEDATAQTAEDTAESPSAAPDLPVADYDSLNASQAMASIEGLSVEELRQLREYEAQNKNRRTVLERLDSRINAGTAS